MHRMRHLIRFFTVCLQCFVLKFGKKENTTKMSLKLEIDSSNWKGQEIALSINGSSTLQTINSYWSYNGQHSTEFWPFWVSIMPSLIHCQPKTALIRLQTWTDSSHDSSQKDWGNYFLSLYGPRHEKTCLRGFWQSEIQTSLLSYRDKLENWIFACSKFRYHTFQKANNKGADQTAQMRRLVCAFVFR